MAQKCELEQKQNVNNHETSLSLDNGNTNNHITDSELVTIIESKSLIPEEAKKFVFGCQVFTVDLNQRNDLNGKFGFVCGDYKKYSKRFPVRFINSQPSDPPYLLKLENLRFIAPPITGYSETIDRYNSDADDSDIENDSESDNDNNSQSDHDSDSSSSSQSSSSLHSVTIPVCNLTMEITNDLLSKKTDEMINQNDEQSNPNKDGGIVVSDEQLQKINANMLKYHDMLEKFTKPLDSASANATTYTPSIRSTKSLPIDCGLRWEPKAVTECISQSEISKIGKIHSIIDEFEVIVESSHDISDEFRNALGYDSVLCLEDHTAMGRVDDIIGSVKRPYYFVRLTMQKGIELKDKLSVGMDVFAVTSLSQFVEAPQTDERYSSDSAAEYDSAADDGEGGQSNKKRKRGNSADRAIGSNANHNKKKKVHFVKDSRYNKGRGGSRYNNNNYNNYNRNNGGNNGNDYNNKKRPRYSGYNQMQRRNNNNNNHNFGNMSGGGLHAYQATAASMHHNAMRGVGGGMYGGVGGGVNPLMFNNNNNARMTHGGMNGIGRAGVVGSGMNNPLLYTQQVMLQQSNYLNAMNMNTLNQLNSFNQSLGQHPLLNNINVANPLNTFPVNNSHLNNNNNANIRVPATTMHTVPVTAAPVASVQRTTPVNNNNNNNNVNGTNNSGNGVSSNPFGFGNK